MCGLLGHFFSPEYIAQNMTLESYSVLMSILAVSMDNRGGDSWGIASWKDIDKWNEPEFQYGLGDMGEDIPKRYGRIVPAVIGHTRKATVGAKTIANCHPFKMGNIIGAHNGSVSNHLEIKNKYQGVWEVDSQAIFHCLDKDIATSEVSAYGAITFADVRQPGNIYLSRFNNGDLAIVGLGRNIEECGGVVWASRDIPLVAALKAAGINDFFVYKIADDKLYGASEAGLVTLEAELGFKRSYTTTYVGRNYDYHPTGHGGYQGNVKKNSEVANTTSAAITVVDIDARRKRAIEAAVTELGLVARIEDEHPTEGMIAAAGAKQPGCDWCDEAWSYYCKTERQFLCYACYSDYTGMVVDNDIITYNWFMWENSMMIEEIYPEKYTNSGH